MTVTLEALSGHVLDIDSHEQIPIPRWAECFGDRATRFLDASPTLQAMASGALASIDAALDLMVNEPDDMEVTSNNVWEVKGVRAPAAIDMDRRPEVLDAMGVKRQLMFPTMGLAALLQGLGGAVGEAGEAEREAAWHAVDAYNEWAGDLTSKYPDRMRVAGILSSAKAGVTPDWLTKEAERLIGLGIKALLIPVGRGPAGLSPADPALDGLYETLAAANVPLVTHPPGGVGFTIAEWLMLDPDLAVLDAAQANFCKLMIFGGVFERHPNLYFAAIECGASWVGPLAEFMEYRVDNQRAPKQLFVDQAAKLPLKPSEYLARNVRATPYNFEPVETWLTRWPHLQDVYCYSSDYPHPEGRPYSLKTYYENVSPLGQEITEKFFCKNAEILLP
jgi:predicted TIM-barrel fold metal-dependent hydrolase